MLNRNTDNTIKAATWYTVSNFISKCFVYLFTLISARFLTTAQYGQFSSFTSWYAILVALISLDLSSSIGTAFLDFNEEETFCGYISSVSVCGAAIPLICSVIMIVFHDFWMKLFELNWIMFICLLMYVSFSPIFEIFQTEQRNRIRFKESSIATLLVSCGSILLSLLFLLIFKNNLNAIILGTVILPVLAGAITLWKNLKRSRAIRKEYIIYALRIALPLIPHVLAATVLGSSDKIMIKKICGDEDTALYSLVYTISMIVTMFAMSINRAWVPWFFEKLRNNDRIVVKNVIRKILPVILVISVGICIFAPEVILIGGEKYAAAKILIPPLVLHSVYNYYYTLYVNVEFYEKKTFGISVVTVATAFLNVLLNYICIRIFGYWAAAYTTLFSALLTLLAHMYIVKKMGMLETFDNGYMIKLLIINTVFCLLILLLYRSNIVRYFIGMVFMVCCGIYTIKNRHNVIMLIRKIVK